MRRLERPPHPALHRSRSGMRRARRRRGPAQRGTRRARGRASARSPYHLGLPTIHSRLLGSVLRRRAPRPAHGRRCTSARRRRCPSTSPDAPASVSATLAFGNAMYVADRLPDVGRARALPALKLVYTESQIGWIPYVLAARRPGVGGQPGVGADEAHPRAALHLLLPERLRVLHQRPARALVTRRGRRRTTSPSRPTTPTATRRGPTPRR